MPGFALLGAPPTVVETIPGNAANDVDPGLREFRVVFDQAMSTGGMSVVGGGPKFPRFVGKPRWESDRTFVWNWQLEPEREYWLSINSDRFTNFRGQTGEPASPYPVAFRTGKGSGASPTIQNRDAIVHLKRAILEDYSYHDLRGVSWPDRFGEFSTKLEESGSPERFARTAAELLAPAEDIHLWLKVGEQSIPTFRRNARWNVDLSLLPQRIPGWRKHNAVVSSGRFEGGVSYLFIRSWPTSITDVEPAFTFVAECLKAGHSLIVDVRVNDGGSETTARQFAGCFVDRPVAYAKHSIRRDGQFAEPQVRELQPNKDQPHFTNRVVVLTGQGTVSSGEAFVMMMKQNPECTLVGDNTAGASGNPQPVDLGNGVTAFVPSWKNMDLDGVCLEGKGIAPDRKVEINTLNSRLPDPVIAAALDLLRK